MASKRKKKKKGAVIRHLQQPLSPKKYIASKARSLPIHECLINEEWEEAKMANIGIVRKQPSGNYIIGFYLVDLLCLGLKDTWYRFNLTEPEFKELRQQMDEEDFFTNIDYPLAHNIIYGGIAFAEDFGFKPHRDFQITEYILEDDENVPFINIDFGEDGEPVFLEDDEDIDDFDDFDSSHNIYSWTEEDWKKLESGEIAMTPGISVQIIEMLFMQKHQPGVKREFSKAHRLLKIVDRNEELAVSKPFEEERDMMDELSELAYDQPQKAIHRIKAAIKNSPDNPYYYDYLATAYLQIDDYDAADKTVKHAYEKFPDHFMAKLNYALMLIENNKVEEVEQIIGDDLNLENKPDENVNLFFNEFLHYLLTLSLYYHETGDLVKAYCYFTTIKDFHPDMALVEFTGAEIRVSMMKDVMGEEVIEQLQRNLADEVLNSSFN